MSNFDKKILIVEDDDMLRSILVSQLGLAYSVIPAADGQEAMQQIKTFHPHLILLDLLLPKIDGFQILEQLRALPDPEAAQTKVVVISNLSDIESIQKAQKYGIAEYFTKVDIDLGTLKGRIAQILGA